MIVHYALITDNGLRYICNQAVSVTMNKLCSEWGGVNCKNCLKHINDDFDYINKLMLRHKHDEDIMLKNVCEYIVTFDVSLSDAKKILYGTTQLPITSMQIYSYILKKYKSFYDYKRKKNEL